jgi:magnesium-transporting ATPase (P-type)
VADVVSQKSRDFVESHLTFVGFVAFACRIRKVPSSPLLPSASFSFSLFLSFSLFDTHFLSLGILSNCTQDSRACVRALKDAKQGVTMVTGDGPLTAFHVAKKVAIAREDREGSRGLLLSPSSPACDTVSECGDKNTKRERANIEVEVKEKKRKEVFVGERERKGRRRMENGGSKSSFFINFCFFSWNGRR